MRCIDCHSKRDFSLFSAPPVPGTETIGGERFDHSMGFPGVSVFPNITYACWNCGLKNWSRAHYIVRYKLHENTAQIGKVNPGEMQTMMPWGHVCRDYRRRPDSRL